MNVAGTEETEQLLLRSSPPPSLLPTPPGATPADRAPASDLEERVRVVLAQAAGLQARREWMQRRDALLTQKEAAVKFSDIARLGKAIVLMDTDSATMVLSVEGCSTLPDRHSELVAVLTEKCGLVLASEDFDALDHYSQLLESLEALDLSEHVHPPPAPAAPSPGIIFVVLHCEIRQNV